MKVKSEKEVAQSCPTLSIPMDCRLPGSSVHGIFQARVLEWGAIAFSNTLEYYSATKQNEIVPLAAAWVDQEIIILSQREKDKYKISLTDGIYKFILLLLLLLLLSRFSCAQLFATPWTATYQAPPSMGFSRQEYWSGVPLPSPIHWNTTQPQNRMK